MNEILQDKGEKKTVRFWFDFCFWFDCFCLFKWCT